MIEFDWRVEGPAWAVFDRRGAAERWVSAEGGVLVVGSGSG